MTSTNTKIAPLKRPLLNIGKCTRHNTRLLSRPRLSDVVLAEFACVLRSRYVLPGEAIARALRALVDNATLAWQSRAAATEALQLFEHGGADFPDCQVVALAEAHGCEAIATFDEGMGALPQVRLL